MNGQLHAAGPNDGDWQTADGITGLARIDSFAIVAINGDANVGPAGFIAAVTFPDGHRAVTGPDWKVYAGAGAPPADGAGRSWFESGYDDHAWVAAQVAGPYGVGPWGTRPGLAGLDDAAWIWRGNPALGVSPVYLRRDFSATPATTAPSITSSAPTAATVGSAYAYVVATSGSPAPTLAVSGAPPWLTLSGNVLSGTPRSAGTTATITLSASNGTLPDATQSFAITVSPAGNTPPTISAIAAQAIAEDAATGALAVTVGDAETASATLTLSASSSNPTLLPVANIVFGGSGANRTVTATPASDRNGSVTVTLTVTDGGGLSASTAFVLVVNAVNDAPSFVAGADRVVAQDAGAQTVAGWATAISAGPSDESSQVLHFTVVTSNPSLFSASPAISASGALTFTSAPGAFGSATIDVVLHDDGGTVGGGSDASAAQQFTITVTDANDTAPTLTQIAAQQILEDTSTGALAFTVSDAETAAGSLVVTASSSNPGLLPVAGIVLGGSGANRTVTATPAANGGGAATVTLTVVDGGGVSASTAFVVTVTPVNDAPSFAAGGDRTVGRDAGPQTFAAWATTVSAGPDDESSQALGFQVSSSDPSLFSAGPAISSDGTLTFTPAPGAHGSATVTALLRDDGGVANGGHDASTAAVFTITVTESTTASPELGQRRAPGGRCGLGSGLALGIAALGLLLRDRDRSDHA